MALFVVAGALDVIEHVYVRLGCQVANAAFTIDTCLQEGFVQARCQA